MTPGRTRSRWAFPVLVAALLLAFFGAIPGLTAQTRPHLVALTPQQLLAKAFASNVPHGTGTVKTTANLGLPDLGSSVSTSPLASLMSGEHTARISWSGRQRARVALLDTLNETDVVLNGNDVWVWQARPARAVHVTVPADSKNDVEQPALTPGVVAKQFLDAIGTVTNVSVGMPSSVAGRSAYSLVLRPKSSSSLIDRVVISTDAKTGLPLKVAIYALRATKPAAAIAFTSLRLDSPRASDFKFTPPPGTPVEQARSVSAALASGRHGDGREGPERIDAGSTTNAHRQNGFIGSGWNTIAVVPKGAFAGERFDNVLRTAPSASGTWGSGRLLHTVLVHALAIDNGPVLVGAVTDAELEAAAAHLPK